MKNPPSSAPENPEEAASPPDQTGENYERFLKQFDEKDLWPLLLSIQQRLGTPAEQPADLDQVRAIAHRLCNVLTVIRIKSELVHLHRETNLSGQAGCTGQCGPG